MLKDKITKLLNRFSSERNAERERLMYLQNRLDAVLNTVAGTHWWKDAEGRYLRCHKAAEVVYGLTQDQIIGKTDFELPWSAQAEHFAENDRLVMTSGKTMTFEEMFTGPNNEKLYALSTKSPLFDEQGNIAGLVGSAIEITELKETQKTLEKLKIREAHFKAMSAIGGIMAHELRTPLTSIELATKAIKKDLQFLIKAHHDKISNLESVRNEYFNDLDGTTDDIARAARYASNTIMTILSGFHYSSLETLPIEKIDLNTIIQQALADYPLSKQERDLITFYPLNGAYALASPNVILHVLNNLLKNALYAIKKVGKGTISIRLVRQQDKIHLIFKDTAEGIPEHIKKYIFEPFYTTKNNETSIGLGLYFCKMALEKMQASISCDSQEGKYTIFDIQLKTTTR